MIFIEDVRMTRLRNNNMYVRIITRETVDYAVVAPCVIYLFIGDNNQRTNSGIDRRDSGAPP